MKYRHLRLLVASGLCAAGLGCAIPGPPRAPQSDTGTCPEVAILEAADDGLLVELRLTALDATPSQWVAVWRAQDGGEPELVLEFELDDGLAAMVAAGEPLPFLDADVPEDTPIRYGVTTFERRCPVLTAGTRVPSAPTSPSAPVIEVVGQTVRVQAPSDTGPLANIYRRGLQDQGPPTLVLSMWRTDEPWVDHHAPVGAVSVYSLASVAMGDGVHRVGSRGPESYAPVP